MQADKQLIDLGKEVFSKYGVDFSLFDSNSLIDVSASFEVNQGRIVDFCRNVTKDVIKAYYADLEGFLNVLLKSNVASLLVSSKTGLGKSFNTCRVLLERNIPFTVVSGNVSPLDLYHKIWEFEQGEEEVMVLDDVLSLLNNKQILALLYQCLWSVDGFRWISWGSTSSKLQAPPKFPVRKKYVFLFNDIPKGSGFEVFLSRCLYYQLTFSREEVLGLMQGIAMLPHSILTLEDRIMIVRFIEENTKLNLNLRMQKKIEDIYATDHDNWQRLGLIILKGKADKKLIKTLRIIKESKNMKEAEERFVKEKIGTARTFWRYKKQVTK